jgi:alkanesulfonate monooxygenase SsuD/methylene tetrahydromethanopterin reductase-like flavin-dependent oxidoreductase (luciferase family)
MRPYIRGETASYQGLQMHSEWVRQPFPIYMASTGPTSCQMAGELGDGVFIGPVLHPEVIKWRLELIARGAHKAGRDPSKIKIFLITMIIPAETREAAMREAGPLHPRGIWATLGLKDPDVADLRQRLARVIPDLDEIIGDGKRAFEAFDAYKHESLDSPHSRMVTVRMSELLHYAGSPEEIREGIQSAAEVEVEGMRVNVISTALYTAVDRAGTMREIGKSIIPHFSG